MTVLIRQISEMIEEEIAGARNYALLAVKYKTEHPTMSKAFYDICTDELRHINMLHGEVVKLIEQEKKDHGEPPAAMMAVYEYMHERQIKAVNEIKMMMQQY